MAEHSAPEPPQGGSENPVSGRQIPTEGDGSLPPQGFQPVDQPPQNQGPAEPAWGAPAGNWPPGPVTTTARPTPRGKVAPWKKVAGGVALAAVVTVGGVAAVTAANASDGGSTKAAPGVTGVPGSVDRRCAQQKGTQWPNRFPSV